MAGDLPEGKWSPVLVGTWWPGPPTGLREASQHWHEQSGQNETYSGGLTHTHETLSRNQGVTADDLVSQFQVGAKFHMDLAEKYRDKGDDFASAAQEVDGLRDSLRAICTHYNKAIDDVVQQTHKDALSVALAELQIAQLITDAQGEAAAKSAAAAAAMSDCLQRILSREGSSMSAQDFMSSQGIHPETPKPPNAESAAKSGLNSELGNSSKSGTTPADAHPGDGPKFSDVGYSSHSGTGPEAHAGAPGAPSANPTGPATTASPVSHIGGGGGAHVPGFGGHVPSGIPSSGVPGGGVPAGGLSPAAGLGQGLSPNSLAQSFQAGAQAGAPISPGAQSLASGAVHAAAPPPQPVAPQPGPSTFAASGGGAVESVASDHASAAPASYGGGGYTTGPTPIVAAPMSTSAAPLAGSPAIPPSSLPAYGADIRPAAVAPPLAPTLPTGPVGGAPVASPAVSPSAGAGPVVSSVERSVPSAAAAAQSNGSAMAAAGVASATAGAVAGDGSQRAAEVKALQAKVFAVARQEPALEWAAGQREDGTTLLTTNLAGGWIPPHIQLPVGVALLPPAARRRDMSAEDLLGAVTEAVTFTPHGYISDALPTDPALAGERARYGQHIDEFGVHLVDAVNRRDGLSRVVQTIAKAAVRGTGVLDSEADQLQAEIQGVRKEVIAAYPAPKPELLANWMLLSAVAAVLDDREALANYHLAWFSASFATTGRRH